MSLAYIGHEECESCEEFSLHNINHTKDNLKETYDVCSSWKRMFVAVGNDIETEQQHSVKITEVMVTKQKK